jgi:hypothetical protein
MKMEIAPTTTFLLFHTYEKTGNGTFPECSFQLMTSALIKGIPNKGTND